MRAKSRVLRRINLLYTLFFAAIVLAIVSAVLNDEFQAAFMDGYRMGLSEAPSATLYEVNNRESALDYDIPLSTTRPDVEARAKVDTFNVLLTGRSATPEAGWNTALSLLAALCYGAIFIFIFLILKSLRSSFRSGNVFERRNIRFTKTIGKLLVVASILSSTSEWLGDRAAAKLIAPGSGFIVNTDFNFYHSQIIMAILILFIAEIFAIGYDLMEEQKLTI